MKKLLLILLVLSVTGMGLYAQEAGKFSVGGRAGALLFGFHDAGELEDYMGSNVSKKSLMNFTFGAYVAYTIMENFSIQGEINFMINQGYKLSIPGYSAKVKYNSIDLPVLVKYNFLSDPAVLGILGGPYLSIPVGDVKVSGMGSASTSGIAFGLAVGAYGGYKLGPGHIIGDLRFIMDLSATEAKAFGYSMDFIKRRGFILTVGYEYTF